MQNYAVNIENLNKTYRSYNKPSDRVKEALGLQGGGGLSERMVPGNLLLLKIANREF